MGILSQPLSRGAALLGVAAVGVAISGSYPQNYVDLPIQSLQFIHLLSIATVVGVGNWTTFVFGIVAFKNLPRQTFGQLQAKLFPKYFQVLTISLAAALLTLPSTGFKRTSGSHANLWTLIVALLPNIANLVAIEPATTATMYKRHKLERIADSDKASHDAMKSKPEYKSLSKKFGMLHGLSSLANLTTVAAAHVHLWNLTASLFK